LGRAEATGDFALGRVPRCIELSGEDGIEEGLARGVADRCGR